MGFEPASTDPRTDPVKVASGNEQSRVLKNAIGSLSDKLKPVIILHDVEGLSQEEVADILGIPVGTVKSRVSRGRDELRKKLREEAGSLV